MRGADLWEAKATVKRDLRYGAERKFGDPGSYVTPDNREILKGIDWTRRKEELWKRCGVGDASTCGAPLGRVMRR